MTLILAIPRGVGTLGNLEAPTIKAGNIGPIPAPTAKKPMFMSTSARSLPSSLVPALIGIAIKMLADQITPP